MWEGRGGDVGNLAEADHTDNAGREGRLCEITTNNGRPRKTTASVMSLQRGERYVEIDPTLSFFLLLYYLSPSIITCLCHSSTLPHPLLTSLPVFPHLEIHVAESIPCLTYVGGKSCSGEEGAGGWGDRKRGRGRGPREGEGKWVNRERERGVQGRGGLGYSYHVIFISVIQMLPLLSKIRCQLKLIFEVPYRRRIAIHFFN